MNKKEFYELSPEPYGKNHPLLKQYEDTASFNLEPNPINFKVYSHEKGNSEEEEKRHVDYIEIFQEKFGEALERVSPEYWRLLLHNILSTILKNKAKSDEVLSNELNTLLPEEENTVKYLITFRKQFCEFLEESKFLEKEVNLKTKENNQKKKKEDNENFIDFLKCGDRELTLKIPTLKRKDHEELVHFKIEHLPGMHTAKV